MAFNNNETERRVSIPVWRIGVRNDDFMEKMYLTNKNGFGYSGERFGVRNGIIDVVLEGRSGVIFHAGH